MKEAEAVTKFTDGKRDDSYTEGKKDGYLEAIEKAKGLEEVVKLHMEVFERANLSPDINFLGDDEHEAYRVATEALKEYRRTK